MRPCLIGLDQIFTPLSLYSYLYLYLSSLLYETWFNWAGSDFSLRFTHLSFCPLISPVHDPFIYIHQLQKSTHIYLTAMQGLGWANIVQWRARRKSSFVWVRAATAHWFAADRDPPTDRLISTLHFSPVWTQFIAASAFFFFFFYVYIYICMYVGFSVIPVPLRQYNWYHSTSLLYTLLVP